MSRPGRAKRTGAPGGRHSGAVSGRGAVRAPNDLDGATRRAGRQAAPDRATGTVEGLTAGERVRPTSGCADSEPKGRRCPDRAERPSATVARRVTAHVEARSGEHRLADRFPGRCLHVVADKFLALSVVRASMGPQLADPFERNGTNITIPWVGTLANCGEC